MYICWILLSISHVLKNPKPLDIECFVFLYYAESKQAKEVLYPKWIHSLSSNIVAAISGLICLKSGTQFGNGWFVSHRECMQWLGLSDTQRGEETWLDRWKITFFFYYYCSGGEDRGWKQSWDVSECSQSLSLCCEMTELKINVSPEPSSLTHSPNSQISSALCGML